MRLLQCLLLSIFVAMVIFSIRQSRHGHVWAVNDWLINYAGGFVRRGLGGWLLLDISRMSGISAQHLLVVVKVFCYALIYLCSAQLLARPRPAPTGLSLLLLVPTALLYPLVNTSSCGRKDIILLAWGAVLSWSALRGGRHPRPWMIAIAFVLLTALHDGLFFFLPTFLLYMAILFPASRASTMVCISVLVPSALLLLLLAHAGPSSDAQINAIIQAFHGTATYDIGAIAYLRKGTANAIQDCWGLHGMRFPSGAWRDVARQALWLASGLVASSLPVLMWWRWGQRAEFFRIWRDPGMRMLFLLGLGCQLLLFAISVDLGRWVMINTVLFTWAAFVVWRRRERTLPSEPVLPWKAFIGIVLVFLLGWGINNGGRFLLAPMFWKP